MRDNDKYRYIVSKDENGGFWYAHMKGYPYIPVFGSIGSKSHAMKVAKTMNETSGR